MRILISGPARSGTTWIANVIRAGSGGVLVHENDNPERNLIAWPAVRRHGLYPVIGAGEDAPVYRALWDLILVRRSRGFVWESRLAHATLEKLPAPVADVLITRAARLGSVSREVSAVVITKSVFCGFSLEWVAARYEPTMVLVRRNPLNVIASWRDLGWRAPGPDETHVIQKLESLINALQVPPPPNGDGMRRLAWWIAVQMRAQELTAARHPDWTVITHDDVCLTPATAMREVFERLGIRWSQGAVDYMEATNQPGSAPFGLQRVIREQADSWKHRLSGDELGQVISVLEAFPRAWWHGRLPTSSRADESA